MRWTAAILMIVSLISAPVVAQDRNQQEERPRLFRGGLIKRFEELQERIREDREARQKDQDREKKDLVKERDERIRALNERIEEQLRRAGLDRNFDPFANPRQPQPRQSPRPDADAPNDDLAPLNAAPNRSASTSGEPIVLGVEVRPSRRASNGLVVDKVSPTSPAAAAGLRVEDRITSLGGSPVKSPEELRLIMSAFESGDRTEVEIVRDGKKETLLVEFPKADGAGNNLPRNAGNRGTEELPLPGNSPDAGSQRLATGRPSTDSASGLPLLEGPEQMTPAVGQPNAPTAGTRAGIGVTAIAVDPVLFSREQLSVRQGAYLQQVDQGSAADQAGLQAGDVIIALDGRKVDSAVGMAELVRAYQPGDQAQILFYRENRLLRAKIEMDAVPVTEFSSAAKPVREAENLTDREPASSSRRNSFLGELSQEFPRLKKVEEMIDRFGGNPQGNSRDVPRPAENAPTLLPGASNRNEAELQDEVQALRSRLRSQDRQIQELTEKLSLIEKLIEQKQAEKQSDDQQ